MTNAPHQDLRQNLDAFIRKYHRNEMLRGLLLLLAAFPVAHAYIATSLLAGVAMH